MNETNATPEAAAAEQGPVIAIGELVLRLDRQLHSTSTDYLLRGRLEGPRREGFLDGGSLLLRNAVTGLLEEAYFSSDGSFSQPLTLLAETDTPFLIVLCDLVGDVVATAPVTISHRSAGADAAAGKAPILSDSLAIEVRGHSGQRQLHVLAPAGTRLPGRFICNSRTTDQCGRVVVPLLRSTGVPPVSLNKRRAACATAANLRLLHEFVVGELNSQLPVGTPVEVELHVEADESMTLRVLIRQAGRAETLRLPAGNAQPGPTEEQLSELAKIQIAYPPLQRLTRLVKRCLFEAGKLADATGRNREQLFATIYDLEQTAEQAHAATSVAAYRDIIEQLAALAAELSRMHQETLPLSLREPPRTPSVHDVADDVKDLQAYGAMLLAAANLLGKPLMVERLQNIDQGVAGLLDRAKRDPPAVSREVRRLLEEVASLEQALTGGRTRAAFASEGMLEAPPGA